jgi:bifunctional UDP-N-acetylglucosamine pyrophosphorylase / glucosamine-1-phosphate N-acetyltransferase
MTETQPFVALVLAAGQGTRMKSRLPKVLHPLLGRPMLTYPIDAALAAGATRVVCVVGHGADAVMQMLKERYDDRVSTALQREQRGTGDAARSGLDALPDWDGWILSLHGDSALITARALSALIEQAGRQLGPLALLTASLPDATGYGRILRDANGQIVRVKEQRDCDAAELMVREFNPGVYAFRADFLRGALSKLTTHNAQGELYLTDLVALAAADGGATGLPWPVEDLHGINDRQELALRERDLALRIAQAHMRAGVTIRDPERARIEPSVSIERDVVIEANVELRGDTRIATGAHIDVGCVLTDTVVLAGAQLLPYCVSRQSVIGPEAQIGPFSHLRPGSELERGVHIGNFVETKKTRMGEGSKANHLSYLGDGVIGRRVNVGAGTIFCNYDGVNKHTTVIEDGAFIGSDSQLVAPVTVGKNSYVGTGTTVTQDVPEDGLAIGRARQVNKPGLAARLRERFKAQKANKK